MLCNSALSENLRGQVYTALVLTILLYGSEVWCLREDLFAKLRTFHNSCCRAMCRITMAHTIRHHIPSKQLYKRLGIAAVDQYYHRRLLRWAGHVPRMPMSRAPRQLLTGWVASPRPIGSPLMTRGRTLKKVLVRCGQSPDFAVWNKSCRQPRRVEEALGPDDAATSPKADCLRRASPRHLLWTPTTRRPAPHRPHRLHRQPPSSPPPPRPSTPSATTPPGPSSRAPPSP